MYKAIQQIYSELEKAGFQLEEKVEPHFYTDDNEYESDIGKLVDEGLCLFTKTEADKVPKEIKYSGKAKLDSVILRTHDERKILIIPEYECLESRIIMKGSEEELEKLKKILREIEW